MTADGLRTGEAGATPGESLCAPRRVLLVTDAIGVQVGNRSGLLGEWIRKKPNARGRGVHFTVEAVVGNKVAGHYWFADGRFTMRRGRFAISHLLDAYERFQGVPRRG